MNTKLQLGDKAADRQEDLTLYKALMQKPDIAWPTVILLVAAYTVFGLSCIAYVAGALPLFGAIMLNAVAAYMCFTVAHEASHSAVCANRKLNDWAGRIAISLLEVGPFFLLFRYVHMQHHRFTNDPAKDVDAYSGTGPRWLLPFKWLTMDIPYFKFYLAPDAFKKRPKSERREFFIAVLFGVSVMAGFILAGWIEYYLLLFFVPTRIAKLVITLAFDFLPHYPHEATAKDAPYQCTSNRVGWEPLLTPLFIYQNYHLVHHLYPTVPFYRNLKVWNARREFHDAQNPATVTAFGLTPKG